MITKLITNFGLWLDTIKTSIFEIKYARKRDYSLKTVVKLIKDNYDVTTYDGVLSENHQFLFVEKLSRVWIHPTIYTENGKNICYVTEGSHGNIKFQNLKGIAEEQKFKCFIQWRYMKNWISTEVQAVRSIDWNISDNKISPELSTDGFFILRTTAIRLLKDIPNAKFILAILSAFTIGALVGSFGMGILNMFYNMAWYLGN